MIDIISTRHVDQRSITSADQVEREAIYSGASVPDVGVMDETISGELDDLEITDGLLEVWQEQDIRLDDEVGSVRQELSRRAELMGEYYPFTFEAGQLSYIPSKTGFYEYCLGIASTVNSITKKPFTNLPRSFERFVCIILQKHMGPRWESLHTGWPRDRGEPRHLDAMFRNLSEKASGGREWSWNPEEGYPPRNNLGGDAGLDFVVWRRSPDGRIGQVFVVGQCACGNDWDGKFGDLNPEKLKAWMRPLTHVPFVRCFTTPFLLSPGNFLRAHKEAGWVLDRARLAIMAEEAADDPDFQAYIPVIKEMFELAMAA
jgi:hypothetical protein